MSINPHHSGSRPVREGLVRAIPRLPAPPVFGIPAHTGTTTRRGRATSRSGRDPRACGNDHLPVPQKIGPHHPYRRCGPVTARRRHPLPPDVWSRSMRGCGFLDSTGVAANRTTEVSGQIRDSEPSPCGNDRSAHRHRRRFGSPLARDGPRRRPCRTHRLASGEVTAILSAIRWTETASVPDAPPPAATPAAGSRIRSGAARAGRAGG